MSKILKKATTLPLVGKIFKSILIKAGHIHVSNIANHFSQYFSPMVAVNDELKETSFNIRHQVYCEELSFEPIKESKQETDEFDLHSVHCVIQHNSSANYAGTVRMVYSMSDSQLLPIEKYCLDSITNQDLHPRNFPRNKICEISRLAVPAEFRRRKADRFKGAATGVINKQTYSVKELRCFPFIAVGLYLSAANIVLNKGVDHVFVMMEPRLARSLGMVGIKFEQIGPVVDYHGERAPFYIDPHSLELTLSPGFKKLFLNIKKHLTKGDLLDRLVFGLS